MAKIIRCGQCKIPIKEENRNKLKTYEHRFFCSEWCLSFFKHIRNDRCCLHKKVGNKNFDQVQEEMREVVNFLENSIHFYNNRIKESKGNLQALATGYKDAYSEILRQIKNI